MKHSTLRLLSLAAALVCLLSLAAADAAARQFTLVIDAGHGGHDAGAKGSFSYEKNINLRTALAFGRYVEKNCPDVNVIYTRKTDVFVPLHKRADIANKNRADVFISIHTNALPAGRVARGLETYTMGMRRSNEKLSAAQRENAVITYESDYKQRYEGYDPNSPESAIMFEFIHDKNMAKSVELAKLVQKNVCATAGRPDKGVKQDVFLVLRETSMPACLIELGFITTADEERLLNDETSIDNIARGIYNAFARYKNDNYSGVTVPYMPADDGDKPKLPTLIPQEDKPESKAAPAPPRKAKAAAPATARQDAATQGGTADQQTSRPDGKTRTDGKKQANGKTQADGKAQATGDGAAATDSPVFKVQIMASTSPLPKNSSRFKGYTGIDHFEEGGMYKYTIGSSADYNAVNRQRAQLNADFPGCFVIAFRDGKKMNINEAIRLFRARRR